ncbi:hypothetical protein U0070_017870 [Myodes glareolus]|uniref:Uncharacterized protein n=1 Tax=Myodes glareolus TaxID=447135 RepID=A0AAW0KA14_MYOGA
MLVSGQQLVICSTYSPLTSLKGKCNNQIHKMCYVQQQQVSQIWKKMMEIMTQDKQRNDLKEVKNKNAKGPKFKLGKLMELHDEGGSFEKTTGDKTGVKVGQDDVYMDY